MTDRYLEGRAALVTGGASGMGRAMALDVRDPDSATAFHRAALDAFGRVDILANAAGMTVEHGVVGHSEELWHRVFDVNVHGVFRMTREVLPGMIEQRWGRIINIASTAATVGAATSAAYCASKAAVTGLTRAVAQEGAEARVTCNSISPG